MRITMKQLISNIPFCSNRHYNCVYVVLDSLLRFYGYNPVVICFNSWAFAYLRGTGNEFGMWGRLIPVKKTLKAFGISWVDKETDSLTQGWDEVKKKLDANTPVAISIDTYPLAQIGLFPRKRHSGHENILSGYDEEQGTVHLVDPSPWQPSERDIPFELFETCWDTTLVRGSGKGRYHWSWLEVPTQMPAIEVEYVSHLIQRNLQAMSARSQDAHIALGLEGIEKLSEDVTAWADSEEISLMKRMARCFDFLQEVALLREGHGSFLRIIGERCGIPRLRKIGQDCERISQSWFVVRNMFLKGSRQNPWAILPRIHTKLADIAARERATLVALGNGLFAG